MQEKRKQIAKIFGNHSDLDNFDQFQIENFISTYWVCSQSEITQAWLGLPMQNCSQNQFWNLINGPFYGIDYNANLIQQEELYYKLLENYKYEKFSTYDSSKGWEVVVLKCKYDGWDKIVPTPWNLLDHMRDHEGMKPHICDWWGKTFTQRGNLK